MRTHGFLLVVLVLAPVCLASPGVGEFFDKLFGVFRPEGIVVTDAPDNATESASNDTAAEVVTKTVITGLDNDTEVISAKLASVVVEEILVESEEATTEATTTDEIDTSSSTPSTTTTVVYRLFHPNTTTTAAPTTTTAATTPTPSSTEATETTLETTETSTTASSTNTTASSTAAPVTTFDKEAKENTTQHLTESDAETSATSTKTSAPEGRASTLAPSLESSTIVNNVLCKTTYNAAANLKVTSCEDSTTTPKAPHRKRRSTDLNVEPLPLADTIDNFRSLRENYPPSSGIEAGDVHGNSELSINTF